MYVQPLPLYMTSVFCENFGRSPPPTNDRIFDRPKLHADNVDPVSSLPISARGSKN